MENIFVAMFYPNPSNNLDPKLWYVVQISEERCNVVDLEAYWELQNTANLTNTLLRLLGKKEGT